MGILRLLLALAVVISHSDTRLHPMMLPSPLAVQAFFIISGFYIACILNRKYNFEGATKLFYQQRYLRLVPLYWIALLLTLGTDTFYSVASHHPHGKFVIWSQEGGHLSAATLSILGITQITMIGLDALMFFALMGHPLTLHFVPSWPTAILPSVRFVFVPVGWSLSTELIFYLVAPFLVRRSVRLQLSVIAASFALRIFFASVLGLTEDPWTDRFFPFALALFLLGSIAYRLLPEAEKFVRKHQALSRVLTIVLGVAIAFYQRIPLPAEVAHWGFLTLVAVSVPHIRACYEIEANQHANAVVATV